MLGAEERKTLDAIAARDPELRTRLRDWAETNSATANVDGVRHVRQKTAHVLAPLADEVEVRPLPARTIVNNRGEIVEQPVAEALIARKRSSAARRVLLCGHLDTVYAADSAFQHVREVDANTWNGPGVADMKGGILVMLEALRALESHPAAEGIGWTVVLNTDEEVGSPSSTPLLHELARQHDIGLVFEPAFPDGCLAGARAGSANFDLIIRGRSAHVGRDFERGRSAIHLAAEATNLLSSLNAADGVTINVGRIDGGGPVNQVANLAIVRMNIRVADDEKQQAIENDLRRLTQVLNAREGYSAELHGHFFSPPKPQAGRTLALFEQVRATGLELGLEIEWRDTGGVCDGNKLQTAGLPTVDSLGVRGGNLHSHEECVLLDSLVERAQLSALLLVRYARGELVV
jgi:glutamate carboxypeptidase